MPTTDTQKLAITLDGIGHSLSDLQFLVPPYQRSYAWEEKHVLDLFKDLTSSLRNGDEEYFVGSIVLSKKDGALEVVDGQQRLATVSMLIAAIRDFFFENGDLKRANHIQQEYLAKEDIRTEEVLPKLKLNNTDNEFYAKAVISMPGEPEKGVQPTRNSHTRILAAYQLAKKTVRDYVKGHNEPFKLLFDLIDYIRNKLVVIRVEVPDDANAYVIFETLNDRGLELAISDLLKNFLLGKAGNRLPQVQQNWSEMFALLENAESEGLVVTYIRHYWSSIHGLTREKVLYNEIKRLITSAQKAVDLSSALAKEARVYVALIDANNQFWKDYPDETKVAIGLLNQFGMVQVRPLLLAVTTKLNKQDVIKTIKLLVSASVRLLIVGGLGGGALEELYSNTAKEIREERIKTYSELLARIKGSVPNDAVFENAFKTATVSKPVLARYYLRALEAHRRKDKTGELIPNSDISAVNLEHILPKNPDKSWAVTEEKHVALLNRLGNLAIMGTKLNSDAANGSFVGEKAFYKKSEFLLTKELEKVAAWNESEIVKRQDALAKAAVAVWPIK